MEQQTVSIKEIMSRVGIGDDTIRKYGFGVSASIPIEKAIEILKPRTVAGGRWPIDKANRAAAMLAELQALQSGAAKETAAPEPLPEPQIKTETPTESKRHKIRFSALDIVFGVNILVADYGLIYLMKEMGAAWAVVYSLLSIHAIGMAKNRHSQVTASYGVAAVWILEILSFFIHLSMFNLRLWETGFENKLPFSVWENTTYPFAIASILAALFSTAAIYSVSVTLALTKEKVEAENFERAHGVKY